MKLKNILIVVNNMEESVRFYKDLFGMQVILNQEENVILTGGLVLQEVTVWQQAIGREVIPENHAAELYFEESDLEGFVKRLEESEFEVSYVNELTTFPWGQKMVRFYDPSGNLIEVRTPA